MSPTSQQPGPRVGQTPGPHVNLEVPRLRALLDSDRDLCFAIEGSPPGSGRSLPTGDGGVRLVHDLDGIVVCVTPTHIDLGSAVGLVRLRIVLPPAIHLAGLLGHRVSLHTIHRLGAHGGFDLRLRAPGGGLVLWAYDGAVPGGDEALAVAWDGDGLSLRSASGGVRAPRELGAVRVEGHTCRCVTLRASADEASFVVLG